MYIEKCSSWSTEENWNCQRRSWKFTYTSISTDFSYFTFSIASFLSSEVFFFFKKSNKSNSNNNNDSENSNFNYNSNTNEYKNNNKVMLITELIKNELSKFNRDDTNKIQKEILKYLINLSRRMFVSILS